MIAIGENNATLCKGDFHPAALYKGDKKIAGYETVDFSGEGSVTLENCYNDKLHNAQIIGNSIQDGTPTPEAPIEIRSVGELVTEGEYAGKYKIPVVARGKNFVDKNTLSRVGGNNYDFYERDGDLITIHGKQPQSIYAAGGGYVRFYFPEDLPSGRYIFSVDVTLLEAGDFGASLRFYAGPSANYSEKYITFTNLSLNQKRKLYISSNFTNGFGTVLLRVNGCKVLIDISALQVEEGNVVTEFEPYIEPQTFNIYLNEPLRKLEDYADYINSEKQKVIRNIKQEIITEIDAMSSSSTTYQRFTPQISEKPLKSGLAGTTKGIAISNKFKSTDVSYGSLGRYGGLIIPYITTAEVNTVAFTFNDESINTLAEAQNAIGNGFEVCYILAEPTEEPIELPELPTFKGTTIYEIDTQIPATISGKYKKVEDEI